MLTLPAHLESIRIEETDNNSFEYAGAQNQPLEPRCKLVRNCSKGEER